MAMATYHPVTHVIFDIDGLLLDSERIYKELFTITAAKFGVQTMPTEVRNKLMGLTGKDAASIIIKDLNLPVSLEKFQAVMKELKLDALGKAELMPGAEDLVMHLHSNGVPIACASSSCNESIEMKTRRHKQMFSCMHHIVSGSDDPEVINSKPAPDIFLVCASRFSDRPDPRNCLVFEDAPHGVTAAIRAHMQVIMVPDPNLDKELQNEATLVLGSLNDFKPELFNLPRYQ